MDEITSSSFKHCSIHDYIHDADECPFCAGILFHCDKHPLQVFAEGQQCLACQEELNGS